jgi:large subunit ribosomal protein L21
MYAIVEVGAKQFSVKKDDIITVEKQEVEAGKELILDKVLLAVSKDKVEVGKPYLLGVSVKTQVLGQCKAGKCISFKYRRRKASKSKKGHRQQLTTLKIEEIIAV